MSGEVERKLIGCSADHPGGPALRSEPSSAVKGSLGSIVSRYVLELRVDGRHGA